MNLTNNPPSNSIDSHWTYRLGDGFSRVHVELQKDGCRIQLIKQTFWESVANIFLALLNQKTIDPTIEEKYIDYGDASLDINQRITSIKDKIFELEEAGDLPASISEKLFTQEEKAAALAISLLSKPQIQTDKTKEKSESEKAESDESKKDAESELTTSAEQQPEPETELSKSETETQSQEKPEKTIIVLPPSSPIKTATRTIFEKEPTESEEAFEESEKEFTASTDQQPSTKQEAQTGLGDKPQDSVITIDQEQEESDNGLLDDLPDLVVIDDVVVDDTQKVITDTKIEPDVTVKPVTDLTDSSDISGTDTGIRKYMKYAGYGLLTLAGIGMGIAAALFTSRGKPPVQLPIDEASLAISDQKLTFGKDLDALNLDLKQVCDGLIRTHDMLASKEKCVELRVDLDSSKKSLIGATDNTTLERLSILADETMKKISQLKQSVKEMQPAGPDQISQLTTLSETLPTVPLSTEQFIRFISQSFAGKVSEELVSLPEGSLMGPGVDYLRDRMTMMGKNAEQKLIAQALNQSLASVSTFEEQSQRFLNEFAKNLSVYQNTLELFKQRKPGNKEEQQRFKEEDHRIKSMEADLRQSLVTGVNEAKAYISDLCQTATEKGFFLPLHSTGALLHFIPEKSIDPFSPPKWTIRRYTSSNNIDFQPYKEVNGITPLQILKKDDLIVEMLSSMGILKFNTIPYEIVEDLFPTKTQFEPDLSPQKQANTWKELFKSEKTPAFPSVHEFPVSFQSPLTGILFVELGPEAFIDFQISTIKHFIDQSEQLEKVPFLHALTKNAVSSLAYSTERAAALKWIDYPALKEKSKYLQDIGNTLRRIDIQNQKRLIEKAPLAAETKGIRELASGRIPAVGIHPLEKHSGYVQSNPQKYIKPITFNKTSIPLPSVKVSKEIDVLEKQFALDPKESFKELRAWLSQRLSTPNEIESLTSKQAEAQLTSLSGIAAILEKSGLDEKEVALALVETAAMTDLLMKAAKIIPIDVHLPIHQMIAALETFGEITKDSLHPSLRKMADESAKDPSKLIFNEAILQRKTNLYQGSLKKEYDKAAILGLGSIPWDTIRLMETKDVDQLPLHVKLIVPEWESLSVGDILNNYHQRLTTETGPLRAVKAIAEIQARHAASVFTSHIKSFADGINNNTSNGPQAVIGAIHHWSVTNNPTVLDRTMLEMLTTEQREVVINACNQIAQNYFTANFQASKLLPGPDTMLTFIKLLVMVDKVMAYSTDREMTRFQVPLNDFSGILKGQALFFRMFDPILETGELQSMKEWVLERQHLFQELQNLNNPLFTEFKSFFDNIPVPYIELKYVTGFEGRYESRIAQNSALLAHVALKPEEGYSLVRFKESEHPEEHAFRSYVDPEYRSPETNRKLPSWFYSLRDLSHFSYHTLRSGFINLHGSNANPELFKPSYSMETKTDDFGIKNYFIRNSLKGISEKDLINYPEIPDGINNKHNFSQLETRIKKTEVLQNIRNFNALAEGYSDGMLPRAVYDINMAMTRFPERKSGYSTEDYRRKWSIRAMAPFQIYQTITNYLEHPEWLTNPEEQVEFLNLLFDPGLLWQHLQAENGVGPKAEADLSKFLHTQFRVHENNPEMQIFLAEVGLRLNQYSAAARKSAPVIYKDIPVPKELESFGNLPKAMLARKDLSGPERSAYGALYAISFIDKPEIENHMVEFLKGVLVYRSNEPMKMINNYHIDRQIDNTLEQIRPRLLNALYPEGQLDREFLSQILKGSIDANYLDFKPAESNPLFFADSEGLNEINLQEGTFIRPGQEGVPIPMDARFSNAFKFVHGDAAYRAKAIDRFSFEFTDNHGHKNIIQKSVQTNDWTLYRLFEDSSVPFQSVDSSWVSAPWLKSKAMLSDYTQWYSKGTDNWYGWNENPEIRLLDKDGKLAFTVELTGDEIKRIVKKDPLGQELVLADIDQNAYAWARQFDDSGYIHAWLSSATKLGQQVEFLRAGENGMRFTWKEGHWQLDSDAQYRVALRQINPFFSQQTNFLLLETEQGGQRLLLPRQAPNQAAHDLVNIAFDRQSDHSIPQRILSFDKNAKTGKFESKDVESNLYLSMLQLGHRNYREAYDLLNTMISVKSGRFSKPEMEILDWIISGDVLPNDDSPQAIAIRTYAAQIKSRNIEKNPLTAMPMGHKDIYEVPVSLKKSYLREISGLSGLRLPPAEEAHLFLKGIYAGELPAVEAISELQISDPESARHAVDDAFIQKRFHGANITLQEIAKPGPSPSVPLSIPRPEVISAKQFEELITVLPKSSDQKELPKEAVSVFDYQSEWYKKLPKPTQDFFKNVESGVLQFQKERDTHEYQLVDSAKFSALLKTLETEQKELAANIVRLRFEILELANPLPVTKEEFLISTLRHEAHVDKIVSFESLIDAFIKNDLRHYRTLNPDLNIEQASALDQALQRFIDMAPEWEYRLKLNESMHAVESVKDSPQKLQAALKAFVSTKNSARQFPHHANRLMKVMEYQKGLYYRKGQVESLGILGLPSLETSPKEGANNISAVHRFTVGFGKTSWLLPTYLQNCAENKELCLAIMPKAQLPSAGRELIHIMKEVYNKDAYVLEFSLNTATTENLEAILKNLEASIANGNPVLTSGSDLKILYNLFNANSEKAISKLATTQPDENALRNAVIVQNIIRLISKTKPLIDEVHKEFEIKLETNHPRGQPKSLDAEYGVLTLNLYDILNDDPDVKKVMHFNFQKTQPLPQAKPFSETRFKNDLAPILAAKFLKILESEKGLDPELNGLAQFYKDLTSSQKADVQSYILAKSSTSVIDWVADLPDSIRNQLAMLRGQLNVLMPATLKRNFGERYGYTSARDIMPIPFASADNPNYSSQFSSPYIRYNYLIQALNHEDLRKPMLEMIISDLKRERLKEMSSILKDTEIELGKTIETIADKEFRTIFKTDEWVLDTPDVVDKLYNKFSKNSELLRHLTKTYALSLVTSFPENQKATSQDFGNLFESWQGVSGTPTNFPTYPGKFKAPQDEAVIGRMLTLMAEHTLDQTHTLNVRNPKEILLQKVCREADAFMDAGGILAGENLDELADAWGAATGKAAVRVDREQGIVVKPLGSGKSVPLRTSSISEEQRVTLLSQTDITGTDIKQKTKAVGIVSISATTTLSTAEQAAGRMRGIESGQSIAFLVLENDAVLIRENLGLPLDHKLTSQDILRHLILVESQQQMSDAETALHHKLQAVINNYLFNWLRDNDLKAIAKLPGINALLKATYFPVAAETPFDLYGREDTRLNKTEAFNQKIERLIGPQSSFVKLGSVVFGNKAPEIFESLRTSMKSIVDEDLKYINETVSSRQNDVDNEQEQELLQEQNTQIETQIEQQQIEIQNQQETTQKVQRNIPISLRDTKPTLTPETIRWNHFTPVVDDAFKTKQDIGEFFHLDRLTTRMNPGLLKSNDPVRISKEVIGTGFFSQNLILSRYFMANNLYLLDRDLKFPLKPVQFVLVVQDSRSKAFRTILLDPDEALYYKQVYFERRGIKEPGLYVNPKPLNPEYLPEGKPSEGSKIVKLDHLIIGERNLEFFDYRATKTQVSETDKIWVGDISGRKAFGDEDIFNLEDESLAELWAQTQVFAGRLNFANERERSIVKNWVSNWSKKNAETPEIFGSEELKPKTYWLDLVEKFIKLVISEKEDVLANFYKTDFGKILLELKNS